MIKFFAFTCAMLFCAGCSTKSATPVKVTYDHEIELERNDDGLIDTTILFQKYEDGVFVETINSSSIEVKEGEAAKFYVTQQSYPAGETKFSNMRELFVEMKTQVGEDGKLHVTSEMTDTETLKDGTEHLREQENRVIVLDRS